MMFDDGLDTVELVMAVEDGFNLSIPDRDAERIQTAGQLADYVASVLGERGALVESSDGPCLTASAFYRVRRQLVARFGVDPRTVRPHTPVERFMPAERRRTAWWELSSLLRVRLPRLELPHRWVTVPLGAVAFILFAAACLAGSMVWVLGFLAFFPVAMAASLIELRAGYAIPKRASTVGDLACLCSVTDLAGRNAFSRHEIWTSLRGIIAHQAGVSPRKVTRETNFITDFI